MKTITERNDHARHDFDQRVAEAFAHHTAGRLAEAEAAYRSALALTPDHAGVTHNLGVVAAAQSRHADALACFDTAIASEPGYAAAHYSRAVALASLGRRRDAIAAFTRASALEPGHYESHRALGFLWLAEGDRDRALDHFSRTYELRRGEDRSEIAIKSLTQATRSKLQHDAEQLHYLSRRLRDGARFEMMARNYEAVAKDLDEDVVCLTDRQRQVLGESYNSAIHLWDAAALPQGAVSPRSDRAVLLGEFREAPAGAVYFDDLLTPQALANLRRHLLESTIWHDFSHIGGFVASYLEDGLACPLVLQIADEIRQAFPELLGAHPLTQAWAFKGLQARAAVDVHADDAAVTVNFWVTPTEANLAPGRGGLTVCRIPPHAGWEIHGYDEDHDRIVAFLEQNAHQALIAPYRENRAVLFESRLFHHSDLPQFAQGYENHRINMTFLYGRHEADKR